MKNCSLFIAAVILVLLLPPRIARVEPCCPCTFEQGTVRCTVGGKETQYGDAAASYASGSGFYFLRKSNGVHSLAAMNCGSDAIVETVLPAEMQGITVKKMEVHQGTAYFLENGNPEEKGGRLISVSIDSSKTAIIEGATDFTVLDGVTAIVKWSEGGFSLQGEGAAVPLSLTGKCTIEATAAKRIVVVTDGDESEMVDLLAGKSVYVFAAGKELAEPSEHNLAVKAVDLPGSEMSSDDMIFYKVYIDGVYAGRTDTAPAVLEKEFTHTVTADKHHLVKMERWELDKKAQQYKRSNNIRQPGEQRLYVPAGRIMALDVLFDGKEYRISKHPVYK